MSDSRVHTGPARAERGLAKRCPLGHLKNWAKNDCAAMWGRATLFELGS